MRAASSEPAKVVVVRVGGLQIGLVVDRASAIISAEPKLVDPVPPVLAGAGRRGVPYSLGLSRRGGSDGWIPILSPEAPIS